MGNNKIIGAKIKSIRESKQLSVEEVAERSGLGIEQIERIESNVDFPSLAPLIKIARSVWEHSSTTSQNWVRSFAVRKTATTPTASALPTTRWKTASIWNITLCHRISPDDIWNRS